MMKTKAMLFFAMLFLFPALTLASTTAKVSEAKNLAPILVTPIPQANTTTQASGATTTPSDVALASHYTNAPILSVTHQKNGVIEIATEGATPMASAPNVDSSTPTQTSRASWKDLHGQTMKDWCTLLGIGLIIVALIALIVHWVRYFSVNGPEGEYYE